MAEAVAYLRVSSKAQDHKTQKAAIERAAQARGDEIVRWYSEKMSGKNLDRPQLKKMLSDASAGLLRKLYVYRLDRVTRSGIADTLQVGDIYLTGAIDDLVADDLGYSIDWKLVVTYRVRAKQFGTDRLLYEKQFGTDLKADKFPQTEAPRRGLNEAIRKSFESLMGDPELRSALGGNETRHANANK